MTTGVKFQRNEVKTVYNPTLSKFRLKNFPNQYA